MKKFLYIYIVLSLLSIGIGWSQQTHVYDMETYAGILPNNKSYDNSSRLAAALQRIQSITKLGEHTILRFAKGRYDFYANDAQRHDIYISNHDNPKGRAIGFFFEEFQNLTIEGNGAEFLFHGRMIPMYFRDVQRLTIKNCHIDFADPQICQVEVIANSLEEGITFKVENEHNYEVDEQNKFRVFGLNWSKQYNAGIAFEPETKHIVYRTADLWVNLSQVQRTHLPRCLRAPLWKDKRLTVGTRVALRDWERPYPGIVLDHCKSVNIKNMTIHYAEGMGLVAQRSEDLRLDGFNVSLRGTNNTRCFTTQADATHFSQCKGHIESINGKYEGMMDDAINVHGIYLKIQEIQSPYLIRASFEHNQCYGFAWGDPGDTIAFVRSTTLETVGTSNIIKSIAPASSSNVKGAKDFWITLKHPLPDSLKNLGTLGIENLTWTPTIRFANNLIRNNRARGVLFSSPRRSVCENNTFDHTSGSAILLCGDCNGWYESGAVQNLVIRNNRFINALTSQYQFTHAVISIAPEIPHIQQQQNYFHGGKHDAILIENNTFETFDTPLLYAKSVKGLIFRNNKVKRNRAYPPLLPNQPPIILERVTDVDLQKL